MKKRDVKVVFINPIEAIASMKSLSRLDHRAPGAVPPFRKPPRGEPRHPIGGALNERMSLPDAVAPTEMSVPGDVPGADLAKKKGQIVDPEKALARQGGARKGALESEKSRPRGEPSPLGLS
jgi:hypothetical protein